MKFDEPVFTEQEREDYLLLVLLGLITTKNLSLSYHLRVEMLLREAISNGFGGDLGGFEEDSPEHALFLLFQRNVNKFTAAKQYQQVREMDIFLSLSKEEFMKRARAVFQDYNDLWLSNEFDTVVAASKSGRDWVGFERNKNAKPYLTYNTQRDNRVRLEHTKLDRITRHVDDPFWDLYTPPNGFNCRCYLTQSATATLTPLKNIPLTEIRKEVPELFRFNPAKTGMAFSSLHPYFNIAKKDAALRRNNFNIAL
jgi:SPP1 gp7 family putative phage head morphogenesis protein